MNNTDEITAAAKDVVKRFKSNAIEYREGKTGLLGFFVGSVMKDNPTWPPELVNTIVTRELDQISLFHKSPSEKEELKRLKREYKNKLL